jgi:hypothetical protein
LALHATTLSMLCRVAAQLTKKNTGEKGLAGLGEMGKQSVPIESGWCRSTGTGRVPVMEQSEHESASEALVI